MGITAFLFIAIAIVLYEVVFIVKHSDQARLDRQRLTYRLNFPRDLDADQVTAFIRSISGTLRARSMRFLGVPTLGFETWATSSGITHRLKVPWQHVEYVLPQLRQQGVKVTPEDEWPKREWTRAVELGLTNSSRTLRIYNTADMAASLLAAMQALDEHETLLVQWVVTPAVPTAKPIYRHATTNELHPSTILVGTEANKDEVHERREKLAEPNFQAVARVAAVAATPVRAQHLIYRVRAALAASRGPSSRFVKRLVSSRTVAQRIADSSGVVNFPITLSAPELTALIAWPIGNPAIAGLPPVMAKHLPSSELVPREGRIIGRSNFPGHERPIAVSYADARKHMHVVGPTGVGKTALLANLIRQDMAAGYGVILIDSKGGGSSLFQLALDYVPPDRMGDVIVLDVNDVHRPVGFNILQQGDPRIVIDELANLFDHLYAGSGANIWTKEVMYHGLRTLATDPKLSVIDLASLVSPGPEEVTWRDDLIRSLDDKELKRFWQKLDNKTRTEQDRIAAPVLDRMWQLSARPKLRNVIGQSTSSFQMADVVVGNKILLVDLSGVEGETASLAGTLLINALWSAVQVTPSQKLNNLYLDEFQSFLKLPVDPEDMLAKARGFGLGMVLAHQHLGQLPNELRQAVLANARTKVVFQTSQADASVMSREFGSMVDESDFMHLGKFEAVARVATGEGVSAPLTLATNEPAKGYGRANQVRFESRKAYSRHVAEVEQEIEQRRQGGDRPKRSRARIAGSSWGAQKPSESTKEPDGS